MQAYRLEQFGSLDHLSLRNEEIQEPEAGEVLLRVHASSLNYRDLLLLRGHYPMSCHPGLVPLSDGAGEVVAVGQGVSRFVVGDRVTNTFFPRWFGGSFPLSAMAEQYGSDLDGWMCEYKTVNQESLVHIPVHLSFEAAATLPCAAVTAWNALSGPQPITAGDTVLTQGSGGVSLFALQLAKMRGANVIATTSNDEKAERLKALGADEVINYRSTPKWSERVRELTAGVGVDRVVEVGGPGTLPQSLSAVAVGGEITIIGFIAEGTEELDFQSLYMSGATLRRIGVGCRDDFEAMNRAISQHKLEPVIDRIVPLAQAREGWEWLEKRQHFGKIVFSHNSARRQ